MQTVRISGREYPERPPGKGYAGEELRRLCAICESLKFSSESCSERERALYKSILEVRAHAENLRDLVAGKGAPGPQLSDLRKHALEL